MGAHRQDTGARARALGAEARCDAAAGRRWRRRWRRRQQRGAHPSKCVMPKRSLPRHDTSLRTRTPRGVRILQATTRGRSSSSRKAASKPLADQRAQHRDSRRAKKLQSALESELAMVHRELARRLKIPTRSKSQQSQGTVSKRTFARIKIHDKRYLNALVHSKLLECSRAFQALPQ